MVCDATRGRKCGHEISIGWLPQLEHDLEMVMHMRMLGTPKGQQRAMGAKGKLGSKECC